MMLGPNNFLLSWTLKLILPFSFFQVLNICSQPSPHRPILFVLLLQEVPMIPQPSYAQTGSIYYICLLRDELLLHQGNESSYDGL